MLNLLNFGNLQLSKNEKIILTMLNDIRDSVNDLLSKREFVGFNPFGETSRGFDEEISKLSIDKLRNLGFRGDIITEEKIDFGGDNFSIYIDPIDGSLNASRRIPIFCYEIGLYSKKSKLVEDAIMGVIWDIPRDIYYLGFKGRGAFKVWDGNMKALESKRWDFKDTLIDAVNTSGAMLTQLKKLGTTRQYGSIAFSISRMLEGNIDGIFDVTGKLKFTDIAGGLPMLNESKVHYEVIYFDDNLNPRVGILASSDEKLFREIFSLYKKSK